jgi:hypothetical protein
MEPRRWHDLFVVNPMLHALYSPLETLDFRGCCLQAQAEDGRDAAQPSDRGHWLVVRIETSAVRIFSRACSDRYKLPTRTLLDPRMRRRWVAEFEYRVCMG